MGALQPRRWLAADAFVFLLAAWLGIVSVIPAPATIPRTELILTSGTLIPPSTETQVDSETHLAATLFLRLDGRPKGQRVRIQEVRFYDPQGRLLGSAPVTFVSRQIRSEIPGRTSPTIVETSKPVDGELFLWPLEGASLQFPVVTRGDLGLGRGDRIQAEVRGTSGLRSFRVRSKLRSVMSAEG
ncbi:MAG TPA: hypothetical protein VND22_03840 [Actinomycetota bacterium]|nr:hypothetical protein [Actinomycetota bacterium]